jgi:hypothetical protein
VITNESLFINEGLPAPRLANYRFSHDERILSDNATYYFNKTN